MSVSMSRPMSGGVAMLAVLFFASGAPAHAQQKMSATELAKLAQNPIGNLVSVPIQNNTNFNVGPQSGTQNILNIQPVYPIEVNKDWNLITRTILPLVWQPGSAPGQNTERGGAASSSDPHHSN